MTRRTEVRGTKVVTLELRTVPVEKVGHRLEKRPSSDKDWSFMHTVAVLYKHIVHEPVWVVVDERDATDEEITLDSISKALDDLEFELDQY